ncbi:MAG: hypothetical protein H6744_00120 [Deltaproteobacteria bacterium]|nr:hypothetical protein [Deltaproteobacteria bacterium]MCB9785069.1 hypothetical protein [Deltaproteobacteria bacterium]
MTGPGWVRGGWLLAAALAACSSGAEGPGIGFGDGDASPPSLDGAQGTGCEVAADCPAPAGPCLVAVCSAEGVCVSEAAADATACDDGNACTTGEACSAGACSGGTNGCACVADGDCAAFEDGDLCNGVLVCEGGGCVVAEGSVVSCALGEADGPCRKTVCEPTTGSCVAELTADDTPCDDGDLCTLGDRCVAGVCAPGGVPLACPASGPCVTVTCEPAKGCVSTPASDGASCSDGDPCTEGEACVGGACTGGTGSCACENDADCAAVDTDLCDGGLVCDAGECVAGGAPPVSCPPASNPCRVNACVPQTGKCALSAAPDGTACAGVAECAQGGSCLAGTCKPAPQACDDGDPCTVDTCDLVKGCTYSGATGPCDDGNPCTADDVCGPAGCKGVLSGCDCLVDGDCPDDGDLCNGTLRCVGGACVTAPETVPSCPGDTDCAEAACDPSTGTCVLTPAPVATPCAGTGACPGEGTCKGTTCVVTSAECGPLWVEPSALDFGVVEAGCSGTTLSFRIRNSGLLPVVLSGQPKLVGCSADFQWASLPSSVTVLPGLWLTAEVTFAPTTGGVQACQVELHASQPVAMDAVVKLVGEGDNQASAVDSFVQPASQDVDVLFVVDNSASMYEEQVLLSNAFADFIAAAAGSKNDYHVGLVTTDIEEGKGRLQGTPRYVTKDSVASFADTVKVGTNGSGNEQGLRAMQLALSAPNTIDSNTSCLLASDCPGEGTSCYDGFCGGANRGFLRDHGTLEIIFLSDEEDHSPGNTGTYVDFMKALKSQGGKTQVHAHALVGPKGGCSSANGDADAGARYLAMGEATGGIFASICSSSFSAAMKAIGALAFGPGARFPLSQTPVPASITVTVAGKGCLPETATGKNWEYRSGDNTVTFSPSGACLPAPGDAITVSYDTVCFVP